jgi:hypothetical protein
MRPESARHGRGEDTFAKSCGIGCHSYEMIFQNRYDERSWRLIVERMKTGAQGGPGRRWIPIARLVPSKGEIDAVAGGWRACASDSKDAPLSAVVAANRLATVR